MDINEFIWKVARMRTLQKEYLENKNYNLFRACVRYERLIDRQLDEYRKVYDLYDGQNEWYKMEVVKDARYVAGMREEEEEEEDPPVGAVRED